MSECWQVDAEKRPTAEELKEKLEEFKKKTENSITTSAPPTSVEKSKLSVSSEPTTKSVDPNKSRL